MDILPQSEEISREPLRLDSSLSYDDILKLLDDLESGELEKRCSEDELERVSCFIANLAREGVLPNEVVEESILESDIQELLYAEDNPTAYSFYLGNDCGYGITLAAFGEKGHFILCGHHHKGWWHKRWDHVKKFAKKHKKAIIIGAVVVVAVAVVWGIAAAGPAGAAAAKGAQEAGVDKGNHSREKSEEEDAPSMAPVDSTSAMGVANGAPMFQAALSDQIFSFKENVANGDFFQTPSSGGSSLGENGRVLGSLFAHDSFNHVNRLITESPQMAHELEYMRSHNPFSVPSGASSGFEHHEIDKRFDTEYRAFPGEEADLNTRAYQLRGERALASGQFNQAVYDLGRVIETNPTNPIPYLEKGIAHFGLGEYDRSLENYHQYTSRVEKTNPLSVPEFSWGVAKGLPRGVYESGEGLFLFMADFMKHPIETGRQLYDAGAALVKMVREDKWGVVAEALCPEMHQVVTQWDSLSSERRGELMGYAIGKYGTDFLLPGALAKVASRSAKSAQELAAICKNIQIAQEALVLETAAEIGNGAKIARVLEEGRKTAFLAEELGFSGREMGQLKQAGMLEAAVAKCYDHLGLSLQESITMHKRARDALKPYVKKPMPEIKVRELIHETGFPTFPRPKGIPEDFLVMVADKGAGMEFVHPTNTHIRVRVMPGKSHSPNPSQQKPYVIQQKSGRAFDKHGNLIQPENPEAHIPLEEFIYRE